MKIYGEKVNQVSASAGQEIGAEEKEVNGVRNVPLFAKGTTMHQINLNNAEMTKEGLAWQCLANTNIGIIKFLNGQCMVVKLDHDPDLYDSFAKIAKSISKGRQWFNSLGEVVEFVSKKLGIKTN